MRKLLLTVALVLGLSANANACLYEIGSMSAYNPYGSGWLDAFWPVQYGGSTSYLWATTENAIAMGVYCGWYGLPDGNYLYWEPGSVDSPTIWEYSGWAEFRVVAYGRGAVCQDYECYSQGYYDIEVRCTGYTSGTQVWNEFLWCT